MEKQKTCILIDGNALMHRSFHGVNRGFIPIHDKKPIGMVFGFVSTLLNVIDFFHPDLLIVAFDSREKTFRHDLDPEYKSHRKKAPDEFYDQIPLVHDCLDAFEIPVEIRPGFESDDLIGTLAKKAEKNFKVFILSGDLDFLQLVSDKIRLAKFNGAIANSVFYGPAETHARYGITPEQIVDFKAIIGDSSDNYKGVAGIGPKTAEKLLADFKNLENILKNLEKLPKKIQEKFKRDREYAIHCKKLAKIHTEIPLDFDLENPKNKFKFSPQKTRDFLRKLNFNSLLARYEKLIKNYDQKKSGEQKNSSKKEENQMALF